MTFLTELENNLKLTRKQRPQMATVITSIESEGGDTDATLYYKTLIMKPAVYWHRNKAQTQT